MFSKYDAVNQYEHSLIVLFAFFLKCIDYIRIAVAGVFCNETIIRLRLDVFQIS